MGSGMIAMRMEKGKSPDLDLKYRICDMSMIIPIVVCNMNTLFCLTKFCQGPLLWKRDWLNLFNADVNGITGPWLIKYQGDKDGLD